MNIKSILLLIFTILNSIKAAKILAIFPTPAISHQIVFRFLIKDLASRGHEILMFTTDVPNFNNPNVTEVDWHSSYEFFYGNYSIAKNKQNNVSYFSSIDKLLGNLKELLYQQMSHEKIQKLIHESENYNFDVMIIENMMYFSYFPLAEIYNCPIIGITSYDTFNDNHEWNGNEANPILHPEKFFSFIQGPLTFSERFKVFAFFIMKNFFLTSKFDKIIQELIEKFYPNYSINFDNLRNRVEFIMVNTHPALGFIRPILPNTIQLGFMHIEEPKPIEDENLKKFLDDSENSVIYMSLGSSVKTKDLNNKTLEMFLKTFSNLKHGILWKFEGETLPNVPQNVMIKKWFPQADLLAHPYIKLFITQGGQQSMEEAIDRAVPMIVIPFIPEQHVNAKRIVQRNIGMFLDLNEITEEILKKSIDEMLKPKYKKNILKLRTLVHDQPMTAREKAVWWTEYVIRNKGAKHLDYTGRKIPFYQKFFLDCIAVTFVVFLIIIFVIVLLFKCMKRFVKKKLKTE
ncbi:hypothetical protein PVAND_009330 [Polypedilum vanderplanki]|uniref:UDP-glucuronosyltransferase n=1 Tax=Polypedilum vanderplanki TaxID=319348 RepID=A0A9J6CD72_POLVA|nr:hypothetical protein PVAND_009330 [Polypedilum vanderplanki]